MGLLSIISPFLVFGDSSAVARLSLLWAGCRVRLCAGEAILTDRTAFLWKNLRSALIRLRSARLATTRNALLFLSNTWYYTWYCSKRAGEYRMICSALGKLSCGFEAQAVLEVFLSRDP